MGADGSREAQVLAFIAERRAAVLGRAVEALSAAWAPEAEPAPDQVAHRLVGTLGTYGLAEAVAVVEDLRAGRCELGQALEALRALATADVTA